MLPSGPPTPPQAVVLPGFQLCGACTCLPLSQPGLPNLGLRPFPVVLLQHPRWGDVAELWWEEGFPSQPGSEEHPAPHQKEVLVSMTLSR